MHRRTEMLLHQLPRKSLQANSEYGNIQDIVRETTYPPLEIASYTFEAHDRSRVTPVTNKVIADFVRC